MQASTRSAGLGLALLGIALGAAANPSGNYNRYFVSGYAAAGAPGDGRAGQYECNSGDHGSTIDSLLGCGVFTAQGYNRTPGATVYSGTVGSSGAITAFQAGTRASEFAYVYPNNVPTVALLPGFSQAYASANLADASLHATIRNNANQGYVTGNAQAELHDIVTLRVAGAGASTVTRVQFRFAVDGTVLDDLQTTAFGERGSGTLNTALRLDDISSAHPNTPDYWLAANGEWTISRGVLQSNDAGLDIRGAHVGGSWTSFGVQAMVFDGWVDIIGSGATLNPTLSLSLGCSVGLQCDYGNTAKFSFINLPAAVSYSSNSGAFLTAVPEPGAAVLMLAGLGGLLAFARRHAL